MTDTTLERAKAGNGDAFEELIRPHRRELFVHCYRILGSVQDAEDVLQETLLSAWRALESFDGRSWRAWLYRIATNRCLNQLRNSARRPQSALATAALAATEGLVSSDEPWWLEPFPDVLLDDDAEGPEARYDTRESIALAFVSGLQRLPVQQRAVLLLRDVLGFSAAETAEMLSVTSTSVNSTLIRARGNFRPRRTAEQVPLPRSPAEIEIVDRFVKAFEHGNLDEVLSVLSEDAKLTMPPEPLECHGRLAIASFLQERRFWGSGLRLVPTRANNQPAFGYYLADPSAPIFRANGMVVLDLADDSVCHITRFGDKSLLARFGLPRILPRDPAG
jgi:RNA polymerase sigma-70 factor (ECF subfamily)